MVGYRLSKRVEQLESYVPAISRWHRIIVHPGEDEDDVRATYEAENGPIGDDGCIVFRIIRPALPGDSQ